MPCGPGRLRRDARAARRHVAVGRLRSCGGGLGGIAWAVWQLAAHLLKLHGHGDVAAALRPAGQVRLRRMPFTCMCWAHPVRAAKTSRRSGRAYHHVWRDVSGVARARPGTATRPPVCVPPPHLHDSLHGSNVQEDEALAFGRCLGLDLGMQQQQRQGNGAAAGAADAEEVAAEVQGQVRLTCNVVRGRAAVAASSVADPGCAKASGRAPPIKHAWPGHTQAVNLLRHRAQSSANGLARCM